MVPGFVTLGQAQLPSYRTPPGGLAISNFRDPTVPPLPYIHLGFPGAGLHYGLLKRLEVCSIANLRQKI